jgi:hypothetical protein
MEQGVHGMTINVSINVLLFNKKKKKNAFFVNFGSQYSASYGVLRR